VVPGGQRQVVNAMALALLLVPVNRPKSPDRYQIRVYDQWFLGGWKQTLAAFEAEARPPTVTEYFRAEP
jgi:hypothetical protein